MQEKIVRERKKYYTLEPKTREYSEEIRQQAIKTFYAGASGQAVGKIFGFSKANVYNWIKKTIQTSKNDCDILELDELYWFIIRKPQNKTRENIYVITMVSRKPRQTVCFDAAFDKSPERIQKIVDDGPAAKYYCTDGYWEYVANGYPGRHIRNNRDKNDTFTVESINADLRHYISLLHRRSRCFPRKIETLYAVLELFVGAYNAFGIAKKKYRQKHSLKSRELPFSVLDFL